MPKKLELTGQRFGKLTVIQENPIRMNKKVRWDCVCDCGNLVTVKGANLVNGETKSCGCLSKKPNEIGKVYGKWTVIAEAPSRNRRSYWLCECECGTGAEVLASNLRRGTSTSCGCQNRVNLIGQRFGRLTVLQENPVRKNEHVCWDCLCDCGNIITVELGNLKSGATSSCGCLKESIGELNIEEILKKNNISYIRQYKININNHRYYFDFAILDEETKVIRLIEFDGIQHTPGYVRGFFTQEENVKIQMRDSEKNKYALQQNIPLVRIPHTKRDTMTLHDLMSDEYLIKTDPPN